MENEVKEEILSIQGKKTSGPYGYNIFFFHDNWEIVGSKISEAVTSFMNTGALLNETNTTTLTTKMNFPTTVCDYMPIACCNILY